MDTIPIELIEIILSYLDTSALFRLCRVNRLLRALAQPHLIAHAEQITMRLWICQSSIVAHKPLDFRWSACNADDNKMEFIPQDPDTSLTLQTALPPPQIDGCTVLIKVNSTRRIYSISYKNKIVPVPVDQSSHHAGYDATGADDMTAYSCSWQLLYDVYDEPSNPAIKRLVPRAFACDTDLLDPQVLVASSREKVVTSVPEQSATLPKESESDIEKKKKAAMEAAAANKDSAHHSLYFYPFTSLTQSVYNTFASLLQQLYA